MDVDMTKTHWSRVGSLLFCTLLFFLASVSSSRPVAHAISLLSPRHYPVTVTDVTAALHMDEKKGVETLVIAPAFIESPPRILANWWKFDQAAGTSATDSGKEKRVAMLRNGATWAKGKFGNAVTFDGVDDDVLIYPYQQPDDDFSITYWFRSVNDIQSGWIPVGEERLLVGFGATPRSEIPTIEPMGNILSSGAIRAYLWNNAGQQLPDVQTSRTDWNKNEWYHLMITYDATTNTIRIYVNGELDGETIGAVRPSFTGHAIYIGRNTPYDLRGFQGTIDNVKLFRYVLDEDDVREEFTQGEKDGTESSVSSVFGYLIPVSGKPSVETVDATLFASLADLTEPSISPTPEPPMYGLPLSKGAYGSVENIGGGMEAVTVHETKTVEYYDVTVIESKNAEALSQWLEDRRFELGGSEKKIIEQYVNLRYSFVLAQINTEKLGPFVTEQVRRGYINPIKLVFPTKKPIIPIKLLGPGTVSQKGGPASIRITVYAVGSSKMESPGFDIEYAGTVKREDVTVVPWFSAPRKWFDLTDRLTLTKLTRTMSPYEITNDVTLQRGRDNDPVGSGAADTFPKKRILAIMVLLLVVEGVVVIRIVRHS